MNFMQEQLMEFFKKTGKDEFDLFKGIYEQDKEKFAVIKISGATLEKNEDEIAMDIAFLNKMAIFPIVIHGAGSKLDNVLPNSIKINGSRVTKKEDIPIIEGVFDGIASSLVNKIGLNGGKAVIIKEIFSCEKIASFGEVGKIINLNKLSIIDAINSGKTPIISPIGLSIKGEKLNINADSAAKEVTKVIQPKKYILLTETGGILDNNEEIIPFINLSNKEALSGISGGMLLKAKEAKDFLIANKETEVVITSSKNLLPEIFTVKGKGTMLKYIELKSTKTYNEVGIKKIKSLLNDSFGKELKKTFFDEKPIELILEKELGGLAIIKKVGGFNYLDKFVVKKEFWGKAIGKSIWSEVCQKYTSFVWRANPINPINCFYQKNCDGFTKTDKWIVYWKGINNNKILEVISAVESKETSFEVKE